MLNMPPRDPSQDPAHWYSTPSLPRTLAVQTTTLELSYTQPPQFGDVDARRDYEKSVAAAIEQQKTEYAVLPRCSVVSLKRGSLGPGDEVLADDVGGWRALDRLVQLGVIHRLTPHELRGRQGCADARFIAARTFTSRGGRGIIEAGWPVKADDFAKPARPAVPAGESIIHRDGSLVPGRPGLPAEAGSDGTKELAAAVARGLVVDRQAKASNNGA